mgnify:CR=1 FL=1
MANHHDFKDVRSVAAMTDSDDAKLVSVSVPKYKIVSYTRKHWARKRILHHHILGGVGIFQVPNCSFGQFLILSCRFGLFYWMLRYSFHSRLHLPAASCQTPTIDNKVVLRHDSNGVPHDDEEQLDSKVRGHHSRVERVLNRYGITARHASHDVFVDAVHATRARQTSWHQRDIKL